ncbi:MAG: MraY family glycosyltransferase [Sulfurospirillaceae bacterium]|nr:MraY family glycosyltransferase [Sulfurospirillaceae bacterium]
MFILRLLSIALLSYLSIKFTMKHAEKINLLDIPNDRSHHDVVIPRGAGIGFIFAFFISSIIFETQLFLQDWFIFASIFVVFSVGILDDMREVSPKLKFIAIFLATYILWLNGYGIHTIGSWFGYKVDLSWGVGLFFSMFALAGFTNALNLIDGLDGLAGSISIVIICIFGFIGLKYHNDTMIVISCFIVASLLGFMFLNWNAAKVFMGDSGSLTLGFVISVLAVMSIKYIHPVTILYLGALPILDTLIVMIRRIRQGKSPFSPDQTHIHHILIKFFDNQVEKTVIFLIILQVIFSSVGYMLIDVIKNDPYRYVPFFSLIGFVLIFILFYMVFTSMCKRQKILDNIVI